MNIIWSLDAGALPCSRQNCKCYKIYPKQNNISFRGSRGSKKFTKPEGKEELEGASGLYLTYWTSHIHSSIVHKPLAIYEYVLTVWEHSIQQSNTKENRGIHGTQHFWASEASFLHDISLCSNLNYRIVF